MGVREDAEKHRNSLRYYLFQAKSGPSKHDRNVRRDLPQKRKESRE